MMGTGKSTIGKLLSNELKCLFHDTDSIIEKEHNLSVYEIFEKYGEDFFRKSETNILKKLNNSVVACGGGVVLKKENRKTIQNTGKSFLLNCQIDEIIKRLFNDKTRPLYNQTDPKKTLNLLWKKRRELYYETADHIIDVSQKSTSEIVNSIIKEIQND